MFTFGREHELKHATSFVSNPEKAELLINVINAVHDLLENKITICEARRTFENAFCNGKSGVWETTGSWIRKLGTDFPEVLGLWSVLSKHQSAVVRYRVACHLNELPEKVRQVVLVKLSEDKSKKVKSMVEARIEEHQSQQKN